MFQRLAGRGATRAVLALVLLLTMALDLSLFVLAQVRGMD